MGNQNRRQPPGPLCSGRTIASAAAEVPAQASPMFHQIDAQKQVAHDVTVSHSKRRMSRLRTQLGMRLARGVTPQLLPQGPAVAHDHKPDPQLSPRRPRQCCYSRYKHTHSSRVCARVRLVCLAHRPRAVPPHCIPGFLVSEAQSQLESHSPLASTALQQAQQAHTRHQAPEHAGRQSRRLGSTTTPKETAPRAIIHSLSRLHRQLYRRHEHVLVWAAHQK
mmetsp:Transcript_43004/g.71469  ORF Transcript_43004/g.71469 Transcript_43004/m.71469 type:complete len:221 (+) Transcript_43004:258-920(+)